MARINEAQLRLVTGDWSRLGSDAASVRTAVFVDEQGIAPELEWDAADAACVHCVAYLDGQPVATGRLLPDAHIGRMAVLPPWRASGVGSRVLRVLIGKAAARGDREVRLSAQAQVTGFYARHGFVAEGDLYEEAGIPHQAMRRVLPGEGRASDRRRGRPEVPQAEAAPAAQPAAITVLDPARVRTVQSSRAMRDGTKIFVHDWSPEEPAARGIYLLHGLGEHAGRYDALARWLCVRGWRVRAHDHVGHGRSDGRRGVIATESQLGDHAREQIDAFAAELGSAPVLLGHSLGGALAAELVVLRGVAARGLILSSPALGLGMRPAQRALAAVLAAIAPSLAVANGLDPAGLSNDPAAVRAYLDDPLVHDRISARLARWLLAAGERSREAAPSLATQTLLLVSGNDRLVDPSSSRTFAERAPASCVTSCWYPELGHELFNEREADRLRVLADLARWLADLPA